ncbi:tetrahydrofolate synthase [Brumimicrobium salinarum]|uniref:Tetrahydrofolate synthase n=1 Tax=Brumimicrobium salinarum TaxID=2058658 RepID=A0A2I0R006_9FLAO|nr:Mur ligase family protein [Brumimicrobium salinarum]PKR79893.1 tetrahydrofolate synthase [Brumimicrobium salinarum]
MDNQEYRRKIEWLFNQFPVFQKVGDKAYKPTLENTLSLIKLFKVPLQEMRFVHVAGTNGKGTTCSIIASTLQSADLKVGLFTSPHIKDFRERIRVNGLMISETEVVNAVQKIQEAQFDFSPSFFEITWVLALSHFYKQNCDVVVVETGLGGRLDATNVIQPELSVITNIGLDHVAILGNDMVQIAKEKAGIIKTKTPVIVGEYTSETEKVFNEVANKLHSNIYFLPPNSNETTFEKNQRLAFKAVDIFMKDYPEKATIKKKGIKNLYQNTGLLGRNQVYSTSPLIIMDAAHNEMGIERLIEDVQKNTSIKMYGCYMALQMTKIWIKL